METNFLVENLMEYLPLLGKIIPLHSQIPILSSILLETSSSGATFSATDLEFGVKVSVEGKTQTEGGVLIPGKQFVEIIGSLPQEKVGLKQEKDWLVMEAKSGTFKFSVLPKDEFPRLFEEKGEKVGEFSQENFNDIFAKLIFAVSQDESRPHLTGVYVVKKEGYIDFVATDGFRLSLKRMSRPTKLTITEGLILPPRLIVEGLSVKSAEEVGLYVYSKGNQAIIEVGHALLVGRLIEGSYPDYEKVIPKDSKTSITVDREELFRLLKTISVFARENANIITFSISGGTLILRVASSSLGEAESKLDGKQEGEDGMISFNIRFVMDFLRNISGKTIAMGINSAFEPALFTSDEDKDFQHVIMPVRVQE